VIISRKSARVFGTAMSLRLLAFSIVTTLPLEKQYSHKRKGLLLIARDENETLQDAFDQTGKPE
jgi:hypothetical protein